MLGRGETHVQGTVLGLPRPGRQGRADGRRHRRLDARAERSPACRACSATPTTSPRCCSTGMTGEIDGKNYPGRRDGADGHEHRRVDCRRRQLRAQQLRQRRAVRHARARRCGAQGQPAHVDVVVRRARLDDADAAREPGAVESDGQPQPRSGRQRHQRRGHDALGERRARRSRACGSRSSCRNRSTSPRFSSTRSPAAAATSASGSAAAAARSPPAPLAAYRLQVSMDGTTWSEPVAEGPGPESDDDDHAQAGARRSSFASPRPARRRTPVALGDPARPHLHHRNGASKP